MRGALTGAVALCAGLASGAGSTARSARTGLHGPRPATPEAALRELSAGNVRWRTFH
ncbi:carbonic anhydrase, partial [Streptomyces sp. NRRL S-444]